MRQVSVKHVKLQEAIDELLIEDDCAMQYCDPCDTWTRFLHSNAIVGQGEGEPVRHFDLWLCEKCDEGDRIPGDECLPGHCANHDGLVWYSGG